jgi:hypothetical protein
MVAKAIPTFLGVPYKARSTPQAGTTQTYDSSGRVRRQGVDVAVGGLSVLYIPFSVVTPINSIGEVMRISMEIML